MAGTKESQRPGVQGGRRQGTGTPRSHTATLQTLTCAHVHIYTRARQHHVAERLFLIRLLLTHTWLISFFDLGAVASARRTPVGVRMPMRVPMTTLLLKSRNGCWRATRQHTTLRAHDDTARSRVRVREQMAHQTSTAAGVRAEEASEKKSTNHRRRRPSRGHPFLPCRPSSRTCPCPPSLFNTGTHSHSLLHLSSYPRSHLMASRSLQAMQTPEPMSERRLLPDQPATSSLQVGIACATIQCRSNEQRSLLLFTALYPSSPPSRRAPSVYEALLHSKTVFARPHTSRLCLRVFSNFIVKK